jgi:hypothetical protein
MDAVRGLNLKPKKPPNKSPHKSERVPSPAMPIAVAIAIAIAPPILDVIHYLIKPCHHPITVRPPVLA